MAGVGRKSFLYCSRFVCGIQVACSKVYLECPS